MNTTQKQCGPVLYLIDSDAEFKSATCIGCKFAKSFDSHVFCNIQNNDGSMRVPPFGTDWDNRGKHIFAAIPNKQCPYIHRVDTWKAGKRVTRTFEQMLRDLSYERGWVEECPGESNWYFKKKNWMVTVNFFARSFKFENLRRVNNESQ